MNALVLILIFGLLAHADESRPYLIPLPGGMGSYQANEQEYKRWVAQQSQIQRRQRMQQQIQNQLQSVQSGSGGGGFGGRGRGGGGGGGSGSGASSSNNNSFKPLEASAFGQIPNFSSNPSQKAIEELVAQSARPDSASETFLDDIKKQIEQSAERPALPKLNNSPIDLSGFNQLLRQTMVAIQSLPGRLGSGQLLQNATSASGKRRRVMGAPAGLPSGNRLVVGQFRPPRPPAQRSPASVVPVEERASRRVRSLSSHRR